MLDAIKNFQRQLNTLQKRAKELSVLLTKEKINTKNIDALLAECNEDINKLIKKHYAKKERK